jgi:transposase
MKDITAIGIDTAKTTFYVTGFSNTGQNVGRKKYSREGLKKWLIRQSPLTVYMEACGGSHEWGRRLKEMGHKVKLIAPHFVTPFRQGDKNDWNDSLAIGIAGAQPTMRYVAIKSVDQQTIQSLHRVRERLQRDRVAVSNQLRGLLAEFGEVLPRSIAVLRKRVPEILESERFSGVLGELLHDLLDELKQRDEQVKRYTAWVEQLAKADPVARELMTMQGIGPITASALAAEVADARVFRNGRQLSAYLGLVPRQFSTGGKPRLGSITKRGDRYLRQLLVHGARSVIRHLGNKQDRTSCWVRALIARRGMNKAVVALANKQARWAWAVMAKAQAAA